MTSTETMALLCAALDEGDDTAFFALADLLEEQGLSERSEVMRTVADWAMLSSYPAQPQSWTDTKEGVVWGWLRQEEAIPHNAAVIAATIFDYLPLAVWSKAQTEGAHYGLGYPSRSAAYLALAEALAFIQ